MGLTLHPAYPLRVRSVRIPLGTVCRRGFLELSLLVEPPRRFESVVRRCERGFSTGEGGE